MQYSRPPHHPVKAWKALIALLRDPDDTAQAFRLVDYLPGLSARVIPFQFERTDAGKRLLASRPNLLEALKDRESLERLPEGSLGRAYLAFLEREGVTADGLVEASQIEREEYGELWRYMDDRFRDQHDLWHTVLGYEGDIKGEASILAFTLAQTGNAGLLLLVMSALLGQGPFAKDHPGFRGSRALILRAFARGIRARTLATQPWEELLAKPISEVRAMLEVGEPDHYQTVHTRDLEGVRRAA